MYFILFILFIINIQYSSNKIECKFYIIKGCPISDEKYSQIMYYINYELEHNRTMNNNISIIPYFESLPECNRTNLDLSIYDPKYIIPSNYYKSREISIKIGLISNDTIQLIEDYQNLLNNLCTSQKVLEKVSFMNLLKLAVCYAYRSVNQTTDEKYLSEFITVFRNNLPNLNINNGDSNSMATLDSSSTPYVFNLNKSWIFNPIFKSAMSNARSTIKQSSSYSAPYFSELKEIYKGDEHNYKHLNLYLSNAKKIFNTFHKIKSEGKEREVLKLLKKLVVDRKDGLYNFFKGTYTILKNLPTILKEDEVIEHTDNFLGESRVLKKLFPDITTNIKESIRKGYKQHLKVIKNENFKYYEGFRYIREYSKKMQEYTIMMYKINENIIKSRHKHTLILNLERKYFKERISLKKNKLNKWNVLLFNSIPNTNKLWEGLTTTANIFNLDSLHDIGVGILWLLSYFFNFILNLLKIKNNRFNGTTCCPQFPLLPNADLGCIYPTFVAVNSGMNPTFFGLVIFPDGFNFTNPGCTIYMGFFRWSLAVLQIPGTLLFGRFILNNPKFSNYIGLEFLVNNATGLQGIAALPPNLIVCVVVYSYWIFLLVPSIVLGIFIIAFLAIFPGRVLKRWIEEVRKRNIERGTHTIDYEHFKAEEDTAKINLKIDNLKTD